MIGLFIQTRAIESKILEEKTTASTAAKSVWRGIGIKAQNKPIAKALEMVRLFHFQRYGACKCWFSQPKLTSSRFGL